jgi:hypothetical protein
MTRHPYLGADLAPIVAAPDLPSFVAAAVAALTQVGGQRQPLGKARAQWRRVPDRATVWDGAVLVRRSLMTVPAP